MAEASGEDVNAHAAAPAAKRKKVFISHSSANTWVAKKIAECVEECGYDTFLDVFDIYAGDDFEEVIACAANESDELLVLLTPRSIESKYVWIEFGHFRRTKKRIVCILDGLTAAD